MSAIKKFFEKKKIESKFKKAGPGYSLTSPSPAPVQYPVALNRPTTSRQQPQTEEQRKAADAAAARMRPETESVKTGMAAIRAQVKREMEAEQAQVNKINNTGPKEVQLDAAKVVQSSVGGVFYTCSLIPQVMLPKKEMDEKIKEFLRQQLNEDSVMASALLIHTVNRDPEKVKVCIETLCTYINNILTNPKEEKFRKIRCSNKAFVERIKAVEGGTEFLLSAGFKLERLIFQDGEEDFYVISEEAVADSEKLENLKEILTNAEPIRAELWRAERLFHCPKATNLSFGNIPDEFFNISKEELKREQEARREAVEKLGMLRTKAMRERDEIKELRKYRYTLIRIRFPNDIYLQAIFKTTETLFMLRDYVRERLAVEWLPFDLLTANGTSLADESKTLAELQLVPASLVLFSYDKTLLQSKDQGLLLPDLLDRLEDWSL